MYGTGIAIAVGSIVYSILTSRNSDIDKSRRISNEELLEINNAERMNYIPEGGAGFSSIGNQHFCTDNAQSCVIVRVFNPKLNKSFMAHLNIGFNNPKLCSSALSNHFGKYLKTSRVTVAINGKWIERSKNTRLFTGHKTGPIITLYT